MDKHYSSQIDRSSSPTHSNSQPKTHLAHAINTIKIRTSAGILSLLTLTGCGDDSMGNIQINADTSVASLDSRIQGADMPETSETIDAIRRNEVSTPDTATAKDTSMNEDVSETSDIDDIAINNDTADSNNTEICTDTDELKINPNAVNVIGQYINNTISYINGSTNNGSENANAIGLFAPHAVEIDKKNHRLFISDSGNNRILVYNLTSTNELLNYEADYVLGQADFTSNGQLATNAGLAAPEQLVYDSANNRLFVADYGNRRVLVYDVTAIANGEPAVNVLGQMNFDTATTATSQSKFKGPRGVAYDGTNGRLFVSDAEGNHRVMVFNTNDGITNGEDAVNVLGQTDFDSSASDLTQGGLSSPYGLVYDSINNRLFVNDTGHYRVMVFDVKNITNGEKAINVLGQTNFTSAIMAVTQNKISYAYGVAYDDTNNRLLISDTPNNRVVLHDTATITDGEAAKNVVGQELFTTNMEATTQSGLSKPHSIAYDSENNYAYIADSNNNRVMVFNMETNPCKAKK